MREIKFRAWDKERRIMYYPKLLGFDYNGDLIFIDANNEYLNHTRDSSFIKLMQYTGLKDINGKEIYEGDIIQLEPPDEEWIGVVLFDKGSFKIKYGELSVILYEEIYDFFGNIYAKIIGNIYENPELLKEVKNDKKN